MQRVLELVFLLTPHYAGGISPAALQRRLAGQAELAGAHGETAHIELELRHCEDPPSRDPAWQCVVLEAKARRFAVAVHDLAVLPGVRVRSWEPVSLLSGQIPDFAGQCGEVRLRASFERHWWRVDLDGEAATVSLDTGSLSVPALSEAPPQAFAELRISLELADVDNPDDAGPAANAGADGEQRVALARQAVRLIDLAARLDDEGTFHLAERDVLTEASNPPAPADKAGVIAFGNGRTLVSVASAVMQNVFQQWMANAPGVLRTGGSEYVHQMRVALRRMRTAYRLLERALREAEIEPDEGELKWIGHLLGDLRDWDVLAESTFPALAEAARAIEGIEPATASTEAWGSAQAEVARRREEIAGTLRAALYSPRYARLVVQIARQVAVLAAAAGNRHATPLNPFGRKLLRRRYRRLMQAKDLDKLPADERHRLRIHAKRLRYAVEFLAPAVDRKVRRRMTERMSALQDSLGVANDAAVARRYLAMLDLPPVVRAFANGYLSAREAFAVSGSAEQLEKIQGKKK
jgi:CHAD domain-containing protein